MKQQTDVTTGPIHSASIGKRILQGAAIALILISTFLFGTKSPKPEWPELWMLKPLLIVPTAGALGGVFYYFMDHLRYQGGWIKVLAVLLAFVAYVILLWIGAVLGLHGTM